MPSPQTLSRSITSQIQSSAIEKLRRRRHLTYFRRSAKLVAANCSSEIRSKVAFGSIAAIQSNPLNVRITRQRTLSGHSRTAEKCQKQTRFTDDVLHEISGRLVWTCERYTGFPTFDRETLPGRQDSQRTRWMSCV